MYSVGKQATLTTALRLLALIVPSLLFLYGLFASETDDAFFVGIVPFISLMTAWMLFGVHQFIFSKRQTRPTVIPILLLHGFSILYILFVSGFPGGLIGAWVLLLIMAYIQYGHIGYTYSATALLVTFGVAVAIRGNAFDIADALITIITTLLVGTIAVGVIASNSYERKTLKKREARSSVDKERLLTIVNNMTDAVLVTDTHGNVTVYNAAAVALLDTNKDISGMSISKLFPVTDADNTSQDLLALLRKLSKAEVLDHLRMSINGEKVRLELTIAPIKAAYSLEHANSQSSGYIIIARDITRRKSLEEERDEFISVVSHELRTPVAVAEGTVSNVQLMRELGQNDEKKIDDSLEEAHDQVVYLARMINDLSTLSRAERGVAAEKEAIDVAALAHDLYTEYSPDATKHGIHLNLDLGTKLGRVSASRLYLHELLQNFITNAIKYTQKGHVTLKITRTKSKVTFSVSDTGIGISKSDQSKIFEKFYRSEDYRTRETGGTGLGLYVAAKLAKKLDTTIQVKSRLNHGSSFTFDLPADE